MEFKRTWETNIYVGSVVRFLAMMLLFSICRLIFYGFNHDLFGDIPFPRFLTMMAGGLQFDLTALLYLNIVFILLQIIPFQLRYRDSYQLVCKWLFLLTNSLGLLANFIDFVYYRFTLKRTTSTVFSQFGHEQNKLKLGLDFLTEYWYLLLAYVLLIWALAKAYDLIQIRKQDFKWAFWLRDVVLMFLFVGLTVVGVRGGWRHSTRPIAMSNAGDFVEDPAETSIVLNTPFCILRTLRVSTLEPVHYFNEQELNNIYSPVHEPKNSGPFKKLNVVFLILESFGKEHIGALNKDLANGTYKGYTPFIDSLVGQSFTFNYTFANGRKSIDALPSVISSIPSVNEPFVLTNYANNKTMGLPALLKDKGYYTAFFHGAPNGSMGFSAYTKMAGIDHYYGKTEYGNDADFDGMWGIWDEPFLQYMAKTMNEFKEPFFSAVFTTSSHHPFKVPEQYAGKFPKGPLEVQECIGYTDMALRKFFKTASAMPWYKNTLFVICADHATVSYFPEYQNAVGSYSVPILFYYPGGQLKGKSDKIVQQIDIMPSVLNYLNYDKPYFSFGFDAFDAQNDNFAVNNNEGTYRLFWKDYVLFSDGKRTIGLYNFKKDRLLKNNLAGQITTQPEMEKKLKAFIQQYTNRMIKNQLTATP